MLAMADRRLSKDAAWDVAVEYQDCEGKLEALLLQLAELQALPPEQQMSETWRGIRAERSMMAALMGNGKLAVAIAIELEEDEAPGASADMLDEMVRRTDQSNELRIAVDARQPRRVREVIIGHTRAHNHTPRPNQPTRRRHLPHRAASYGASLDIPPSSARGRFLYSF